MRGRELAKIGHTGLLVEESWTTAKGAQAPEDPLFVSYTNTQTHT